MSDEPSHAERQALRRVRGGFLVVLTLLMAGFLVSRIRIAPDVRGLRVAQASSMLSAQGLGWRPSDTGDEDAQELAEDVVKSQDPAPGSPMLRWQPVSVAVMGSSLRVVVPRVVGEELFGASLIAQRSGLGLSVPLDRKDIHRLVVASASPAAGALAFRHSAIEVTVTASGEPWPHWQTVTRLARGGAVCTQQCHNPYFCENCHLKLAEKRVP